MPEHVVDLVEDALNNGGYKVSGSSITILGLSFKGNSGDLRNTPVVNIFKRLKRKGAKVKAYDPLVDPDEVKRCFGEIYLAKSLDEAVTDTSCIIIAADHVEIRKMKLSDILRKTESLRVLVDSRNVFDPNEVISHGLIYRGIGRRGYIRV